ncbi:ScnB [Mycolicibacterium moriokaense]|nr:ScnB [Mycolicibacterium moriokaense]
MSSRPYDVLLETLGSGEADAATLPELARKPDPWESAMQATCECLSWRGTLDNLERRHSEDALGETTYRDFPVHARSAVVTAHELMDRGAFSADELRARMAAVRDRFNRT